MSLIEKIRILISHPSFKKTPLLVFYRLISWRIRCWLGISTVINLPKWNVKLFLPAQWRGAAKIVYLFREDYDSELISLNKNLLTGNVFVDAGANIGIYTIIAAKLVGESGRVIAFEPTIESYNALNKSIELNELKNVQVYQCALSNREGKTRFYTHPDSSRNSLGPIPGANKGINVNIVMLDKILEQEKVSRVDFIKMDVEGAEELVLKGATNLLSKHKPVILFESNFIASKALGLLNSGAWDFLKSEGYKIFTINDLGEPLNEILTPSTGNFIAVFNS